jgi:hypothetical protein
MATVILATIPYEEKIVMVSDLNTMFTILLCGISVLILMFLLASLKLKRQGDSSLRIIRNGGIFFNPTSITKHLLNIEEEQKFASAAFEQLAKIIEFLPDLDD